MGEWRSTRNKTAHPALNIEDAKEFIVNSTSIASDDRIQAKNCPNQFRSSQFIYQYYYSDLNSFFIQ